MEPTESHPHAIHLGAERLEALMFRGVCHGAIGNRAFGGQVLAQSLHAAGQTVPAERIAHSAHGYYIRGGRAGQPIVYRVEATRDGRSFSTRQVQAVQDGEVLFSLTVSFQVAVPGAAHGLPMPDVPLPDELTGTRGLFGAVWDRQPIPAQLFDFRFVPDGLVPAGSQMYWVRAWEPLGEDPLAQLCAISYVSDIKLASIASGLDRAELPGHTLSSLDHSIWFHQPARADEWLLYHQHGRAVSDSRGLASGEFFTVAGDLVASVAQEVLIRPRR
ncbi:acyl-CoA thioesterase [Tomitella biformata]|uniref:acyl-CoA thioesterase n=1 Tax=Tomitella biformata TaxID=630403 RepID=UPI00046402E9|nr:acyl-CoA thioesterase domain-containing protein [Tomitella biformata]